MPFASLPRLSTALASALAAGLMLTLASCSHVTPLGPGPTATLPPPHQLSSPLVLQALQIEAPASAGSCPGGQVALAGGPQPTTCYRQTSTRASFPSAGASAVSSYQPPTPSGQPKPPVQYGFWITLPASASAPLTTVIRAISGPQSLPSAQSAPISSASTSALAISVAGHTYVLAGFGVADSGRQFQAFLSTDSQARQVQQALAS